MLLWRLAGRRRDHMQRLLYWSEYEGYALKVTSHKGVHKRAQNFLGLQYWCSSEMIPFSNLIATSQSSIRTVCSFLSSLSISFSRINLVEFSANADRRLMDSASDAGPLSVNQTTKVELPHTQWLCNCRPTNSASKQGSDALCCFTLPLYEGTQPPYTSSKRSQITKEHIRRFKLRGKFIFVFRYVSHHLVDLK